MGTSVDGKPLEGVLHPPKGDPKISMKIVCDIMDFMNAYGVELNIWDHFYTVDMCPTLDGIPADLWWKRFMS